MFDQSRAVENFNPVRRVYRLKGENTIHLSVVFSPERRKHDTPVRRVYRLPGDKPDTPVDGPIFALSSPFPRRPKSSRHPVASTGQ